MNRVLALAAAVAAIAVGAFVLTGRQGPLPADALIGAAEAQDTSEIDTSTIVEMAQGAEDAPLTIIEYASYTCPHCADFHQTTFKKIKADYVDTGKVRFIYREVYFDRYGLWASMIARCGGPEKFFGITDLIYQSQDKWARAGGPSEIVDELRKIGRLAGLDKDQLEACLQDGAKAQTLVAWYQENAEEHDINSTPSFIIDGEKVSNQSYEDFKTLIESKLGN